jgi:hypothetical protein
MDEPISGKEHFILEAVPAIFDRIQIKIMERLTSTNELINEDSKFYDEKALKSAMLDFCGI